MGHSIGKSLLYSYIVPFSKNFFNIFFRHKCTWKECAVVGIYIHGYYFRPFQWFADGAIHICPAKPGVNGKCGYLSRTDSFDSRSGSMLTITSGKYSRNFCHQGF